MSDIALDTEATARSKTRAPLELLTRIPTMQPFPANDIRLSPEAWELLFVRRRRGAFVQRGKHTAAAQELQALGLLTLIGSASPTGIALTRVRYGSRLSFGALIESGGRRVTFSSWYSGFDALVAAEIVNDDGSTSLSIHDTSMSDALGLLLSWLRIAPAWTYTHDVGDGEYDAELIEKRIDAIPGSEPPVPEDASWVTRRAWAAGGWARCEIISPSARLGLSRIRTGDVGWFTPEELPGARIRLKPTASLDVMRDVIATFHEACTMSADRYARSQPRGLFGSLARLREASAPDDA
ncbi:hypothetical protein [Clavibacter sp. CT19]|uniref:hypothetical protein n=1 Tax=unclassified Clavibacter TaxID=2626594 RepID=UPI0022EB7955|nr:hypothetical protein [Clavibacter sp. CT19]MDA3805341.1 hypothetical protein [Clavibacter sp. CT19]